MIIKTTETELKIDMLDTPFVSNWKEYMNRINQPSFNMHQWFITGWPWETSADDSIDVNIQRIEDALDYCDKHITTFDFSLSKNALIQYKKSPNQKHLNLIHRQFTAQTIDNHLLEDDNLTLNQKVHDINAGVHKLETFQIYPNLELRQKYKGTMIAIVFTNANTKQGDYDTSIWTENQIRNCNFDHTIEDTNCNVWLNEDILGKDLIRCFLDGDDPNNKDITGNTFLTPSLLIDVDNVYHNILISEEFNEWHSKLCPNKTLNRWPIGNIDLSNTTLPTKTSDKVLEYSFE